MPNSDPEWPPRPNTPEPSTIAQPPIVRAPSRFVGCLQIVGFGAVSGIMGGIVSIPTAKDQLEHYHMQNDMDFGALLVGPATIFGGFIVFGLLGALSRNVWLCAADGRLRSAAIQALLPGILVILLQLMSWFILEETWHQFTDELASMWVLVLWVALLFVKGISLIRALRGGVDGPTS